MYRSYQLSHADAMKIVDAIHTEAEKRQKGAAIAVVDSHGELLAFLRMDGCPLPPITIAQGKAFTSARERAASFHVGKRSREEGFPMTNFGDKRFVTWGGGIPIFYEGELVGAVGVSGLSEDEDMELAKLGIAALGL